MKLLSVNVSKPIPAPVDGKSYQTGIYKAAVAGRVWLSRLNLAGDGQADLKNHGGPDRAVYCYPQENYAFWAAELDRDDFRFGQFGENLTLQGLLENVVCIGDSYRIGEALIQVSQPRVPCYKLADKMGLPGFAKTFLRANRPGFYARVLEEGWVAAGDSIALVDADPLRMTVAEVNSALYLDQHDRAAIEKALRIEALSPGWKESFESLLQKA